MRRLHHMAGSFVLAAIVGAGGLMLLCKLLIVGLPALTRVLDALTGS